jgi:uncharacterized protein (TIGR02145 family)
MKMLHILFNVSLISVLIFFQSCSDNPTSPEEEEVLIPETTKQIDSTFYSSNLVNVSEDSLTFTFQSGFTSKYNPAVNDVLVIAEGEGLLRKVTAVQSSGNNVVLTTTQATLEEAIEQGNISLNQSLQEAQINKVDYYYEGISYKLNKGSQSDFYFNMDIVLYDLDGDSATTNDQVKLIGNFTLDASVVFQARISSFKLQNIKMGMKATNSESLELLANLNYTIQKEITLARIHFSPIYLQLGPIPVIIVIKLDIKAGGSGYANASMSVGFENSVSYEAGINYVRGQGWNPYSNFENQFSFNPPELTANAGARVFVKPEVSVGVYGVLAGYANAEAYGEIMVNLLDEPWWKLYAGLDFGVGARAKIFGVEVFDFQKNVLELEWLLAQASVSASESCPGIPTVTDTRNGKVYKTILIGSQCWLKENMDIGTRINGSQAQTNNNIIEKYCYNDDPANCSAYGGLYQWKEAMQYATTPGAKGICPTGWHIPTLAEFITLGQTTAGNSNELKAVSQGTGSGAGTNTSGFSALLGGNLGREGAFEGFGESTFFWSSTQYDAESAGEMDLYYDDNILYLGMNEDKNYGYSVRCIKD